MTSKMFLPRCAAPLILLLVGVHAAQNSSQLQPYQRLITPTNGAKMTIAPGLTFPSMQLSTIESTFNMRMPIQVQFPTLAQTAQSFIQQVFSMPIAEGKDSTKQEPTGSDTTKSRAARARINSRIKFYETIETAHKSLGKSCLLRAICEVAEVPFVASNTGFLGEIFDILLTSSPLFDKQGKMTEYLKAEHIGRQSLIKANDGCKKEYKECPFSLFKILELANEVI